MIPIAPALSSLQRTVPLQRPLSEFDYQIGPWHGRDQHLSDRVRSMLRSADLLLRQFGDPQGHTIDLYVSFFPHQQQGQASHSPKNCLPGAGWQPLATKQVPYPLPGSTAATVNEIVYEKEGQRMLVLYWYRERDRIVASEYWMKWYLMWDALARNRTDGALIRLSTPMGDSEHAARERLAAFARLALPRLNTFLPE